MLDRRQTLRIGALGGAALLLPGGARGAVARAADTSPFSLPLVVPPVKRPVRRTATTDYYEMTMREATAQILPGVQTPVMTYDGCFPGPTIRARPGRRVVVRQRNALGMEAVVHLHGAHVPADSDGHPKDPIAPGAFRDYVYPNLQPAATLWYHDHTHHMEAEMVFRGLAGCYLLDEPRRTGLPAGRYDLPLMLRDAQFDDQGGLVFTMGDARKRTVLLVNGCRQPYHPVAARKYRLRLINGANTRYFTLGLSDGRPMWLIASDGGLLPAPVRATGVTLSPGERVDAVVDFADLAPGSQLTLRNTDANTGQPSDLLRFDVVRRAYDPSRIPSRLGGSPPDLGPAAVHRDIVMGVNPITGMSEINGRSFDMDRIDQRIQLGQTEEWRIVNSDVNPPIRHNLHVHGTHFQVIDRNGVPVSGHEAGWKDTVAIPNGGDVRIRVRYERYTGLYLYHCHLLDHSSMGMMAQSEVTA
ncbi:multicopper oxidase family protein [Actinoallomurus soli]|uniref:multicopper oxidase family protein n=1 Tax=Actinoallomurus soli TaxID=2952535 RepID=UPI00209373C2|nr:multicopper oxidase domain-containing protein [Actinoallomurus soli]MCO5967740.1 multicopper oxidase domain-containing protein [Actinoallomurus soli]